MLSSEGFDLWADGYDISVGLSDEENTYPFAGYRQVLNRIYQQVLKEESPCVLDIGFGTGTLTAKLYEQGCHIWGLDFSERMIELAKAKMPEAVLVQGDFSKGLPDCLKEQKYDAIVATYSLHHLEDGEKAEFLKELLPLLKENGRIYIGDVAFKTRTELEKCREASGEEWDDEEIYFVYNELEKAFPGQMSFEKISHCAGVITLLRG